MGHFFMFFVCAFAVERLAELGTTLDALEGCRTWWQKAAPKYAQLATCKFCQSFWASGFLALLMAIAGWPHIVVAVLEIPVVWLSVWGGSLVLGEFMERYLNRAPLGVMMMKPKDDQASGS